MKRIATSAALIGAALVGCSDQSVALSDRAILTELDGSDWGIISPNGAFLIEPQITALSCEQNWAFGHHDGSGYFLLNLETGQLSSQLKKSELSDELARVNLSFTELHAVESFDRYFSGCG
ncbi:MAG: hypothetical protein ABJN35_12945 [Erythrobacter sp.]